MNTTDEKELDHMPANDPLAAPEAAPLSLGSREGTPSDIALAHDPSLAVPIGSTKDVTTEEDDKAAKKDKKKAKKKAKKKDKKDKKKEKKSKKAKKAKKAKKSKKKDKKAKKDQKKSKKKK